MTNLSDHVGAVTRLLGNPPATFSSTMCLPASVLDKITLNKHHGLDRD
jgi:hypothetical protein